MSLKRGFGWESEDRGGLWSHSKINTTSSQSQMKKLKTKMEWSVLTERQTGCIGMYSRILQLPKQTEEVSKIAQPLWSTYNAWCTQNPNCFYKTLETIDIKANVINFLYFTNKKQKRREKNWIKAFVFFPHPHSKTHPTLPYDWLWPQYFYPNHLSPYA